METLEEESFPLEEDNNNLVLIQSNNSEFVKEQSNEDDLKQGNDFVDEYEQDDLKQSKDGEQQYVANTSDFELCDLKTSIRAGEQQTKVVSENIEKVETHFPNLVQDINLYTVRSAKLRDAGDNFSKSLQEYAASETPALRQGLSAFAECFAAVQDHRNVLVNRLENKVVQAFSVYETKCKQAKSDVKQHNVAHSKELNEHKSFQRVKTKATQQFQLAKAEAKFQKASEEANRSAQTLNDQVSDFERQKTRDLKKVFGEFMLSEMLFYSKALEIYTRSYQELMEIDEEENVGQLQESMKFTPHQFVQSTSMYGGSAPSVMHANMPQTSSPNVDQTI